MPSAASKMPCAASDCYARGQQLIAKGGSDAQRSISPVPHRSGYMILSAIVVLSMAYLPTLAGTLLTTLDILPTHLM